MTAPPDIQRPDYNSRLGQYTASKVAALQGAHLAGSPQARGVLAVLRRGVNKALGSDIELVGLTVAGLEPVTAEDAPTAREQAAYTAVTLYALHQQGISTRAHSTGPSFGAALGKVRRAAHSSEPAVRRRFTALGTATSWDEIRYHCRSLIPLLRENGAPLDYGRFAEDLYKLQHPESALRVRLAWGRDFEYTPPTKEASS